MGLLPLEFSDCLLDSPYFRENLKAHEKQLDQTSACIKGIVKDIQDVLEASRVLSKAKKSLSNSLSNFQFDCLGTSLTDDEIIIANSLREFARYLTLVEDEMDRMLEHAHDKFIVPLEAFRKEQIGSVRKTKKDFEKATGRFCAAQDRYINLSSKKEESLAEAAEAARFEKRNLDAASLQYVYLMHVVQERKKFEFVEAILSFMHSWANYYKHGQEVTSDFADYMTDLKSRVQKTRENYSATIEQYDSLREKMRLGHQDPGLLNKMYTRQGYLYAHQSGKKNQMNLKLGSQWTKYYCQYQAKTKTLTMIPYSQLSGKITSTETLRVNECVCKEEASSEKYRFVVSGEDLAEMGTMTSHTFQAISDYERKHWVEAMGGTWPAVNTLQRIRADSVEDNLNSLAFTFLKDCLSELEARGLNDQGLYRVGGVVSKVKSLLNRGLDPQVGDGPLELGDPKAWESKTIASAVKQYFRDLSKPLTTHHLYASFVDAVKHESEEQRIRDIHSVVARLPIPSREILKVLVRHLSKVALNSDVNLMTASNLGVCFGPTLLRPKEETVASIMDIKFCNEVVEILIENCHRFFPPADSSPEVMHHHRKHSSTATVSSTLSEDIPDNVSSNSRNLRGSSTPKQVITSFSQLSTNSLPDIKEFKVNQHHHHQHHRATTVTPTSAVPPPWPQSEERPRSKSHQHNSNASHQPHPAMASKQSSLPMTSISSSSLTPTTQSLMKSLTQDDLMASLEMMNFLASDLPTASAAVATAPLRRSLTVQANRPRTNRAEITRKPPLPKLSLASCPETSSSSFNPPPFQRHNSSPSPSVSSNSSTSSPRPSRPSDLLQRLQAQQQLNQERRNNLANNPPAVPTRKYRRIIVSPTTLQDHVNKVSEADYNSNGFHHSVDSGVMTSPSPPTDSGVALSPPILARLKTFVDVEVSDDAVSVSSSSVSGESEANTSGASKYENVLKQNGGGGDSNHQSRDEDGDDEAEASETGSSSGGSESRSVVLDEEYEEEENGVSIEPRPDLLPDEEEDDEDDDGCAVSRMMKGEPGRRGLNNSPGFLLQIPEEKRQRLLLRSQHERDRKTTSHHRDSGPYENVFEQQRAGEETKEGDNGELPLGKEGIISLRTLLAEGGGGQTTNV